MNSVSMVMKSVSWSGLQKAVRDSVSVIKLMMIKDIAGVHCCVPSEDFGKQP